MNWKLVPLEPTPEMLVRGQEQYVLGHKAFLKDCAGVEDIYKTMLEAAPAAPVELEPVAWGVFYFGGKRHGKLYSQCYTKDQVDRYIADLHHSNDYDTFRSAPLYALPPDAAAVIAAKDAEIADALDVKNGKGPTALGMVVAERDQLRKQLAAAEKDAARYRAKRHRDFANSPANSEEAFNESYDSTCDFIS